MSLRPPSAEAREIEEAIFETACGIADSAIRRSFLVKAYQSDPEGLVRIEALIESARESAAFFLDAREQRTELAGELLKQNDAAARHLPVTKATDTESSGARIGRYRLLERIGEGGCGVVYEAEQEGALQRRVALKIIRPGMDTKAVIERFENERRALALMDHPNIARVFDAGATETGRPYFVMELVRGERITAYCDERCLGLRERLALFVALCHAIQHAHQKGVMHRDIKPSNVLVALHEDSAVLKVIDFGIAKATESSLIDRAMLTGFDQFVGTPVYMSPEQVDMCGSDVDTRSDVYSLGALLYELITGAPPFDPGELVKSGLSEMRRTLLERDPAPPSARLAAMPPADLAGIAAQRGTELARLIAQVRSDLDWIVAVAMDKDRNRRYKTVNGLAMDVERFLHDRPVSARRPSRSYLLGKFIRRNRIACVSGLMVAVSLIGGLGASSFMYLRERAARHEQQRLRHQAEGMANVSTAAVLLSQGKIKEADAILQITPVSSIEPSREAADVFRSLGEGNAMHSRWKQAAECFDLLMQANRLFSPDDIWGTGDLLRGGPAMLEAGESVLYEKHRRELVERFSGGSPINTADQVLKISLLAPARPDLLEKLAPAAETLRRAMAPKNRSQLEPGYDTWYGLALALYECRRGNFDQAVKWAETAITTGRSETAIAAGQGMRNDRDACLHAVIALAFRARGDAARVRQELAHARDLLAKPVVVPSGVAGVGMLTWQDPAIARILVREAEAPAPAPQKP